MASRNVEREDMMSHRLSEGENILNNWKHIFRICQTDSKDSKVDNKKLTEECGTF